MTQFRYSPIARDEIRLLRLQPSFAETRLTTQPRIELVTTKLSLKPLFEALSYQWTPAFCSRSLMLHIQVHEQHLAVNETLYNALRHLQLRDVERIMWIDAICINQSDNEEKEQQVDRMDEIYKAAGSVVAWLGIPEVWEERLLKDVSKLLIDSTTLPRQPVLEEARMLAKICDNGYWGRTWVIQEVVLARAISILFGTTILDFEALTDEVKWKKYNQTLVTNSSIDGMLASRAFRLRGLRNELRSGSRRPLEMPLLVAWIEHGAQSQCSVKTDEIFAVRSFAKQCCRNATPVQYKTNGRELFLMLTDHHFTEHRFEGEEWILISTEIEFHAQLLKHYTVEDAATVLPVQFNDWLAMGKSHGRDPKFAIAIAKVMKVMAKQQITKAMGSRKNFTSWMGTGVLHATAPMRALVDSKWKHEQFKYWMLMREHIIGLVNSKPSPLI